MNFSQTCLFLSALVLLPCGESFSQNVPQPKIAPLLQAAYATLFPQDFLLHDIAPKAAEKWDDAFAQVHQFVQMHDVTQIAIAQRLQILATEISKILHDILQYYVIHRDGKTFKINFGRAAKQIVSHETELDGLKEGLKKKKGEVSELLLEAIDYIKKASEAILQELAALKRKADSMQDLKPGSAEYAKERIVIKETV